MGELNVPNDEDIDYLHPEGKPRTAKPDHDERKFDGRVLEEEAKSKRNALTDADGHHICSTDCQKRHHKVQT